MMRRPFIRLDLLYSSLAIQLFLNYKYTIAITITIFMNDVMIIANYNYQLQLPQQWNIFKLQETNDKQQK